MKDVTYLINAMKQADSHTAEEILPLLYQKLRILAAQKLSKEPPGQTLQPTALVHEAYLRLLDPEEPRWDSRGHFFAAAAEAMRRILVENARKKKSLKHGGNCKRISLSKLQLKNKDENSIDSEDLLALDEALDKLYEIDKKKADVVKLRYFAGLSFEQIAEILDISPSTAHRHWAYARSWLRLAMDDSRRKL